MISNSLSMPFIVDAYFNFLIQIERTIHYAILVSSASALGWIQTKQSNDSNYLSSKWNVEKILPGIFPNELLCLR